VRGKRGDVPGRFRSEEYADENWNWPDPLDCLKERIYQRTSLANFWSLLSRENIKRRVARLTKGIR
jgi:TPP-dependent pyruvate/acetoin dehydrogenase alpha subunit